MKLCALSILTLCGLPAFASAAAFTVGGYSWDSDNAVTTAVFSEGGPGFIGGSSFPEGTKSVGNLLTGGGDSFFIDAGKIGSLTVHKVKAPLTAGPNSFNFNGTLPVLDLR